MKENRHFNDLRIWLEAMRSVSRTKDCRYYLETTYEDMNTKALRLVRHWQCLDRLCREPLETVFNTRALEWPKPLSLCDGQEDDALCYYIRAL
ncbi:hypothetical protein P692DRAFT_20831216 [Suillus brevipes Sb2]|nr:hypothetical protein P692DRAFT_20831216 [Suillus brevipes Sb2]